MRAFRNIFVLCIVLLLSPAVALAGPSGKRVSGVVTDAVSGQPLVGAVLKLGDDYLWAVSGLDGDFEMKNVQAGKYTLKVSLLGYVDVEMPVDVKTDVEDLKIVLQEQSLALEEVVVTAQRPKDGLSTSHKLGREALDHLQMSNMSDMSALLPGGKTVNPDLTTSNALSLRAGGSSAGNAAFGTALEVDGVRMGNNAGMTQMSGVDTRSISVDNIESVEVITGVPSAEYGDLNSGMVRINTKKGRTPYNVNFSVNPRTYQVSASKGFDLQKNRGILNASLEWARATRQLVSPYESYTRRGLTLNYSNTFAKVLRFEAGFSGNIGGMNSKDDPDAFKGEFTKVRDNVFRGNVAATWLLNRSWITNLKFDASVSYQDNLSQTRKYHNAASKVPAVHADRQGYFLASSLPFECYPDAMVDSKELDYAASLKYEWTKRWGETKSQLKAGVQWKANGNVGRGEYYLDPSIAADGFRERDYRDYPFMHNLSVYAEEHFTLPVADTRLEVTAGLRMENVFIHGSEYKHMNTWSPRFNAKWSFGPKFSIRGGWGVTEKLPSFYILYPKQEYWDKETFQISYGDKSAYVYYTQPYQILYNQNLRWQRNQNAEIGLDAQVGEFKLSAVGFYNVTKHPYKLTNRYDPVTYSQMKKPSDFVTPDQLEIKVDDRTGQVYLRGGEYEFWKEMETKVVDQIFVKNTMQDNGATLYRAGAELTVDFPEIKPIRTSFRADASYTWTKNYDSAQAYYYRSGSHTSIANRSYEWVGVYPNGGNNSGNSLIAGKLTHNLDANVTAITHIPEARLVITCRLEMLILTRSRNLPAPGVTRNEDLYWELWPIAVMDTYGRIAPVGEDGLLSFGPDAADQHNIHDSEFRNLKLTSSNIYSFDQDGYGFYCSANLSITKEIGKHVSLSFFANNFTNSRPYVVSKATGVGAIFTPAFYYGLTCRIKI